jgi:hypothetical protein
LLPWTPITAVAVVAALPSLPATEFTVGEQMAARVWEKDSRRLLGRRDREGIGGETWEGTERGGSASLADARGGGVSREEGGGGRLAGLRGLG